MTKEKKPIIGISMGDMNGIGPEVIIKSLNDKRILDFCTPVIYGSKKVFEFYLDKIKQIDLKFHSIKNVDGVKGSKVNLISVIDKTPEIEPGQLSDQAGKLALQSLELASEDLKNKKIDGLITAPLDKSTVSSAESTFTGHTEYLASLDEEENYLMLMVAERLRVALVSGHIPLKSVSENIKTERIIRKIELLNKSLIQDFGIQSPKIAVLGLNPHAGENGVLGDEETKEIIPAINQVKTKGIHAFGPFPADGFFGALSFTKYDAVLAMYHDQGLIPIKTMFFDETVNFTAGLSFTRTSPDHGTAYDIAGKNMASPNSFRNAIYLACDVIAKRLANASENEAEVKATQPITEKS